MLRTTLPFAAALLLSMSSPALAQEALPEVCSAGGGHMTEMPGMAGMPGLTEMQKAYMQGMDRMHPAMMAGVMAGDPDVAFVCGMIRTTRAPSTWPRCSCNTARTLGQGPGAEGHRRADRRDRRDAQMARRTREIEAARWPARSCSRWRRESTRRVSFTPPKDWSIAPCRGPACMRRLATGRESSEPSLTTAFGAENGGAEPAPARSDRGEREPP